MMTSKTIVNFRIESGTGGVRRQSAAGIAAGG
jgi:hypothetical protein